MERKQDSKERDACAVEATRSLSLSERRATKRTKQRVLLSVFMGLIFRRLSLHNAGLRSLADLLRSV